ncbi:hypothetical protein C4J88_2891 [Pseudomonas sp. R4-39-08]|nr:hypothetical protein C4J88_2891 [Pseudomonas sp. R4-39-08]
MRASDRGPRLLRGPNIEAVMLKLLVSPLQRCLLACSAVVLPA